VGSHPDLGSSVGRNAYIGYLGTQASDAEGEEGHDGDTRRYMGDLAHSEHPYHPERLAPGSSPEAWRHWSATPFRVHLLQNISRPLVIIHYYQRYCCCPLFLHSLLGYNFDTLQIVLGGHVKLKDIENILRMPVSSVKFRNADPEV